MSAATVVNRRDFLRASGISAAGLWLSVTFPGRAWPPRKASKAAADAARNLCPSRMPICISAPMM